MLVRTCTTYSFRAAMAMAAAAMVRVDSAAAGLARVAAMTVMVAAVTATVGSAAAGSARAWPAAAMAVTTTTVGLAAAGSARAWSPSRCRCRAVIRLEHPV